MADLSEYIIYFECGIKYVFYIRLVNRLNLKNDVF